jgi:hypothetical protein
MTGTIEAPCPILAPFFWRKGGRPIRSSRRETDASWFPALFAKNAKRMGHGAFGGGDGVQVNYFFTSPSLPTLNCAPAKRISPEM